MKHPTRYTEAKARQYVSIMRARHGRGFEPYLCGRCGCWHVYELI
ncbi:hypothetical protein [Actinomadura geliboluensis]